MAATVLMIAATIFYLLTFEKGFQWGLDWQRKELGLVWPKKMLTVVRYILKGIAIFILIISIIGLLLELWRCG